VHAKQVKTQAEAMKTDLFRFLRDMIAIPSTSMNEAGVVERIIKEMKALDYDEVKVDPMGNVMGRIGNGKRVIVFDGHIDTVDVGEIGNWTFDPFKGKEDEAYIYGRGASDQEGGFASAVYAGALIKKLGLPGDFTLWVVGSVQEEDCDGLCWQYILDEKILQPDFVVSTEPTSLNVYRGQRGRMEIRVNVKGVSSHGSAPERGDNAIYKMAPILMDLQALNTQLKEDPFLGKGSLTVSEIFYSSPSRCAVADGCSISIDRRLTFGETADSALEEIRNLDGVKAAGATVAMYRYKGPSYTGLVKEVDAYFPAWAIPEEDKVTQTLVEACRRNFDKAPFVDKWTFSTNGVATMGLHRIPTIGFGPGREEEAHAPNEKILKQELVEAVKVLALVPSLYEGAI